MRNSEKNLKKHLAWSDVTNFDQNNFKTTLFYEKLTFFDLIFNIRQKLFELRIRILNSNSKKLIFRKIQRFKNYFGRKKLNCFLYFFPIPHKKCYMCIFYQFYMYI